MQLYDFIYGRLVDANIAKDTAVLKEALDLVVELRDTWAEAMKLSATKTAANRG
jgi:flagellar protein FliS